jgi:outer membrane lipoprotein-sorting protein
MHRTALVASTDLYLQRRKPDKGVVTASFRCLYVFLLIAVVPLGGCLFRSRAVTLRPTAAQLQTATGADLVERINATATKIQTLKATVRIAASVGGSKRGKITEYEEIHGYILARKPSTLRMTGLFPILQNHLFDMVSNGQEFKLWIPPKNEFIVGTNDVTRPSVQPLENLRPQVIYDALLLHPVDLQNEFAVLEVGEHVAIDPATQKPLLQPDYTLDIIKKNGDGWYLSRKTVFDRADLQPHQQVLYNERGSVVTDVRYDQYREFNGVFFPTNIQIWRPQEEYTVKLQIIKLTINGPIMDDQFVLEPPSGASMAAQ